MEKLLTILVAACLVLAVIFGGFLLLKSTLWEPSPAETGTPSPGKVVGKKEIPGEKSTPVKRAGKGRKARALPKEGLPEPVSDEREATGVCGRVCSWEGKPLAGAKLLLIQEKRPFPPMEGAKLPLYVTQPEGAFSIQGLSPGQKYRLFAAFPEYPPGFLEIKVEKRGTFKKIGDIVLRPGAKVHGRVTDSQGNPVAAATLSPDLPIPYSPSYAEELGEFYPRAQSGPDGSYCLSPLPQGEDRITVYAAGFCPAAASIPLEEGEEVKGVDFVLAEEKAISGTVKDKNGLAIEGARVFCRSQDGKDIFPGAKRGASSPPGKINVKDQRSFSLASLTNEAVYSDESGSFIVQGLPEGTYRIDVEAEGFVGKVLENVPAGEKSLDVVLTPAGRVSGIVKSIETGKPIERFTVTVQKLLGGHIFGEYRIDKSPSFSDPEGRFSISSLQPGEYEFEVQAEEYALHRTGTMEIGPESFLDLGVILLGKAAAISGRVLSQDEQKPLEDAKVIVEKQEGKRDILTFLKIISIHDLVQGTFGGITGLIRAQTDSEGVYRISGLEPGTYSIEVLFPGYAAGKCENISLTFGQNLEEVNFFLPKGGTLTGRVFAPSGDPLPNKNVIAESPSLGAHKETTDGEGRYTFPHLIPGTYFVRVEKKKKATSIAIQISMDKGGALGEVLLEGEKVLIEPGETVVRDFYEKVLCTVTGTVYCENVPLSSCTVELRQKNPPSPFPIEKSSFLDQNRMYSIQDVESGEYVLSVRLHNAFTVFWEEIDVPPKLEHRFDIVLVLGSLSGAVRSSSGQPIPGVKMKLEEEEGGREGDSKTRGENFFGETDSEGCYEFCGIPAGHYKISAKADHFTQAMRGGIRLEEGQKREEIDFVLQRGGSLEIRVVDEETGRSLAHCFLTLQGAFPSDSQFTNSSGTAYITSLSPGVYLIQCRREGYQQKEMKVTVEAGKTNSVTLPLSRQNDH